jgi:predicted transcriptional regulator of viral defense system
LNSQANELHSHNTTQCVEFRNYILMSERKIPYNYLEDYLLTVRSKGRFTVTQTELAQKFDISTKALHQNLFRLKSKNQIAQIRQGFYAIIPPEYSHQGMLPVYLFVDDLMKSLHKSYYLGLFSAAALHGAGHQQPMESQIIIENPALRDIKNDKLSVRFFIRHKWNADDIIEKKTDAGYIKVSSPELTALDLVSYSPKIGGINRLLPILEDLIEVMKPSKLYKTAKQYNQVTIIQRLGFLLDCVIGSAELSTPLKKLLNENTYNTVPLSIAHKSKEGEINTDWKIIINTDLQQ